MRYAFVRFAARASGAAQTRHDVQPQTGGDADAAGADPLDAAPLTCAGVTTYKAVKVARVRSSETVAVFGVGLRELLEERDEPQTEVTGAQRQVVGVAAGLPAADQMPRLVDEQY